MLAQAGMPAPASQHTLSGWAAGALGGRSTTLVLLLTVATLLLGMHVSSGSGGGMRALAAAAAGRRIEARAAAVPADFGGVQHYAMLGQLPRVPYKVLREFRHLANETTRTGVLHLYLKALRWPDANGTHRLHVRGFAAFETPTHPYVMDTFYNVPEMGRLRLMLASRAARWRRQVAMTMTNGACEKAQEQPGFDLQACLAALPKSNVSWWYVAHLRLDLGPADAADTDLALEVDGWPRSVSLRAQLRAALQAPAAQAQAPGAPRPLVRALPYLTSVPAGAAARVLEWHEAYHAPLGLRRTLLYVRTEDVAELEEQPWVAAQLAAARLTLVRWRGVAPYKGWRDHELQVVQNHAVLSLWGHGVRVLLADWDELLVPGRPEDTLLRMLAPGGCLAAPVVRPGCLSFSRRNLFPHGDGPPTDDEAALWQAGASANPLPRYRFAGPLVDSPKLLVEPEAVAAAGPHVSSVCIGTRADMADGPGDPLQSECSRRQLCSRVPPDCAYIAHIPNMWVARREAENTTAMTPSGWLWMLQQTAPDRARSARGDQPA